MLIWAFWGSVITAMIFNPVSGASFYPSGLIGQLFAFSVIGLLGSFGAWFAIATLMLISFVISFKVNISKYLKRKEKAGVSYEQMKREQEEAEELLNLLSDTPEEKFAESPVPKPAEQVDIFTNSNATEKKSAAIKEEKIEKSKEWDSFVTSVFEIEGMEDQRSKKRKKIDKKNIIIREESENAVPATPKPAKKTYSATPVITAKDNPLDNVNAIEFEEAVKSKEVNIDKVKRPKTRNYKFPSIKILTEQEVGEDVTEEELLVNAQLLEDKLADFNVDAKVVKAYAGPVVTMFELTLAPGIKISKVTNLTQDLAMGLQARGIRIIAPIPGKATIGVEIPNRKAQMVRLRGLINSKAFTSSKSKLTIALGKTVNGEVFVADLAKMPHLLIAGTTGSGKSVGINTIITSILYRAKPDEVKFVMIDPKMLELSPYKKLEQHHLAFSPELDEKVLTKPENAVAILNAVVDEMDRRYNILSKSNVRKLEDYNDKIDKIGVEHMPHPELNHKKLPFIVVVIDELADLMITAAKEVEQPIARLAQMARAIGIHLVVATQRPSVDVLTGVIKANFPTRLAYQVAQKNDSRTILDMMGADQLLGNGDMLFLPPGEPKPIRLQNGFISTDEIENVISHISRQPPSDPLWLKAELMAESRGGKMRSNGGSDRDQLFDEAKKIVVMHQQGSVSLLQRRLAVGYARAARIMDQLEEAGIVGPFGGSKARQVLLTEEDL